MLELQFIRQDADGDPAEDRLAALAVAGRCTVEETRRFLTMLGYEVKK